MFGVVSDYVTVVVNLLIDVKKYYLPCIYE